ncbi:MAG: D-alanyl-D-alanine carboxypeptidase family protein [Lachnospiraceae bacterium]
MDFFMFSGFMRKRFLPILLSFLLFLTAFFHPITILPVHGEDLDLTCEGAVLMEVSTGTVLFDKNPHKKLRPASITKIMTLLLIFQAMEQGKFTLSDIVTTSEHAASMGGSNVFLEANEQQTVETMIKCICIASANDAAVAMAEHIAGSEEKFVAMMNQKAKDLSMNETHFENACGLDADGHVTSAYDIAIMSRELITRYPQVLTYTGIWMDSFDHVTKRGTFTFELANTNKLIKQYPYATGLKTGSTSLAKYSVSATASKDGLNLIAVILAAKDYKVRFSEAISLLNYGFANVHLYEDTPKIPDKELKVLKGDAVSVPLKLKESFRYVDTSGGDLSAVKHKITLPESITAPVKKGDVVGSYEYYLGEKKIGSIAIYAAETINRLTYSICIRKMLYCFLPF